MTVCKDMKLINWHFVSLHLDISKFITATVRVLPTVNASLQVWSHVWTVANWLHVCPLLPALNITAGEHAGCRGERVGPGPGRGRGGASGRAGYLWGIPHSPQAVPGSRCSPGLRMQPRMLQLRGTLQQNTTSTQSQQKASQLSECNFFKDFTRIESICGVRGGQEAGAGPGLPHQL